MLQNKNMESEKLNCGDSLETKFIASPPDVDTCRKLKLQDVEVLNHHKTTVGEITTGTMLQSEGMEIEKPWCDIDRYRVPEYSLIQCWPTRSPPKFLRSHSRSAHVRDSLWEPLNCVQCMANRCLQA